MTPDLDVAEAAGMSRNGWRVVLLASLGGTLEFYDFVVFGVFASDIGNTFFPSGTPLVSLMAFFASAGVPVGAPL
jgi:hypothetical protein